MTDIHVDSHGDEVEIHSNFIQYRDRILTYDNIDTFCVKNKRLLINHYKQNLNQPTMCIIFETKQDAIVAFRDLRTNMFYRPVEESSCWNRWSKWLGL